MTTVAPAKAPPPADDCTRVDLVHLPGAIEHWVRFGRAVAETIVDRRRRTLWYARGSVIAFVRWQANAFGTVSSRIEIMSAARPGEAIATVPGVMPGGILLLRQSGWPSVRATLAAIDEIDALGLDPADICPDHWRQLHHHVTARSTPRRYSIERHNAWRRRQAYALC